MGRPDHLLPVPRLARAILPAGFADQLLEREVERTSGVGSMTQGHRGPAIRGELGQQPPGPVRDLALKSGLKVRQGNRGRSAVTQPDLLFHHRPVCRKREDLLEFEAGQSTADRQPVPCGRDVLDVQAVYVSLSPASSAR